MRKYILLASAFVVGYAVGTADRKPAPPPDYAVEVHVTRSDGSAHVLTPYRYTVDGRVVQLADRPESDAWCVQLAGGRVVVHASERRD